MRYCYKCLTCDHRFEVSKPMADAAKQESCPACEEKSSWHTNTERDFSAEKAGPIPEQLKAGGKYPYVSRRLPKELEGCPTDGKGNSVIVSRKHEKEISARYGYHRE